MRVLKKTIWPHQIIIKSSQDDTEQRIAWLKEKMPIDRWYVLGPDRYAFKTQQDAVMFALRFS